MGAQRLRSCRAQVIVVLPDSIDDMDWTNPRRADDGYTHDWWHIEVRRRKRCCPERMYELAGRRVLKRPAGGRPAIPAELCPASIALFDSMRSGHTLTCGTRSAGVLPLVRPEQPAGRADRREPRGHRRQLPRRVWPCWRQCPLLHLVSCSDVTRRSPPAAVVQPSSQLRISQASLLAPQCFNPGCCYQALAAAGTATTRDSDKLTVDSRDDGAPLWPRRYTGPPFCSRSTLVPCNGAVILHASANAEEMGPKVIPILWMAGVRDPLYVRLLRLRCPSDL